MSYYIEIILYFTIEFGVKVEIVFIKLIGTDQHVNPNKNEHLDIYFDTIARSLEMEVTA